MPVIKVPVPLCVMLFSSITSSSNVFRKKLLKLVSPVVPPRLLAAPTGVLAVDAAAGWPSMDARFCFFFGQCLARWPWRLHVQHFGPLADLSEFCP